MPSLGGGTACVAVTGAAPYSLLLQGEWRFIVNRGFETALFYDAGKGQSVRADPTSTA